MPDRFQPIFSLPRIQLARDSSAASTPTKFVRFHISAESRSSSDTSGADTPDSDHEGPIQLVHLPTQSAQTSNEEFLKLIAAKPTTRPSTDLELSAEEIEHIK